MMVRSLLKDDAALARPVPRRLAGWLLVGLLHAALVAGMMQGHAVSRWRWPQRPPPVSERSITLWLLPSKPSVPAQAAGPAAPKRPQPLAPDKPSSAGRRPVPAQPRQRPTPLAAEPPDQAPQAALPAPPPGAPDDPFAAPAPARSSAGLLEQAKRDVAKIDKELRKSFPERAPIPAPDSKQAILERGMNAAYDARPLKWYEAGRVIELSTPDGENKSRIYKVITALGTYCVHVSHTGSRSYTTCPK